MNRLQVLGLVALGLAGCTAAEPGGSATASSPPASASAAESAAPSATAQASQPATPSASAEPSAGEEAAVVEPPSDLLPPGSVARVTADGLRVRGGPPGSPEHKDVRYTLNAGDLVLVDWTPLAYVSPSESADGRGWYSVHVGGASVMSYIDGGVNGWVAAGEDGLDYFEHEPVPCTSARDLENLIYSPFTGGDQEQITTPWQRLACNGDRQLELTGILDYVCPEGGIYPYRFDPHLAAPQWCTALMIDAIDPEGFAQYGQGLVVRFPEFAPSDVERGDVVRVRGHFDDPASTSCTAETEAGFDGFAVDLPFLVLFCREQFVPEEWEVIDHRELAPLPWAP
jgi:hypothetical protein